MKQLPIKKILLVLFLLSHTFVFAKQTSLNLDLLFKNTDLSNKHVVVFFHMSHCPYCERMDKSTLANDAIQTMLQKDFIFIDINTDEKQSVLFNNKIYTKKEFAHSIDVDFFPTVVFFDKEKEIIYTARGLRKVDKFKKILRFIQTKSYEENAFFDYK